MIKFKRTRSHLVTLVVVVWLTFILVLAAYIYIVTALTHYINSIGK